MLYSSHCIADDSVITYVGKSVDLTEFKIGTLFKGKDRVFVADKLDVKGIDAAANSESNIWYLELIFNVSEKEISRQDIWLEFRTNINAANVYINQYLLFENGIVGSKSAMETGGKSLLTKRILRKHLVGGANKIVVEFSNFKKTDRVVFRDLRLGSLAEFHSNAAVMSTSALTISGIFIFAIFVNIALYFSLNRKKVFILLTFLFLVNFLLMAYEGLYWNGLLNNIAYIDMYSIKRILEYSLYFILLCVVHFQLSLIKKEFITAISLYLLALFFASFSLVSTSLLLACVPLTYCLYASWKNKNSNLSLISSLAIIAIFKVLDEYNLIESYDFIHSNYILTSFVFKVDNLGMVIFALIMIFTTAKSIITKTNDLNDAKMKVAQLEYQFTQKHIQPHFLMNTLMSLQQLVSKDAKIAGEMIEALSQEFYLLTTMSKKNLVPIQQEIDLCHIHLKIMSIQQRADYHLEVSGIIGDEMVPPAVFHTLIENGITHGFSGQERAYFTLIKETFEQGIRYRVFNNGKAKDKAIDRRSSGTGLSYIEARLQQWQPNKWHFTSHSVKNGWEASIEIRSGQ
jgi:hypothetical protein